MSNKTIVTLSKGGTKECKKPISQITIPDLWHIAGAIRDTDKVTNGPACADLILECWNRCHDLKRYIQES